MTGLWTFVAGPPTIAQPESGRSLGIHQDCCSAEEERAAVGFACTLQVAGFAPVSRNMHLQEQLTLFLNPDPVPTKGHLSVSGYSVGNQYRPYVHRNMGKTQDQTTELHKSFGSCHQQNFFLKSKISRASH